jgi:hypothetical protein
MIEYTVRVYNDFTEWSVKGIVHRENGPAVEYANGSKHWYKDGQRHRENGPAVEYADGSKQWWVNDHLHREDGPAIVRKDGKKWWLLHGVELSEAEFNAKLAPKSCIENKIVEIDGKKYRLVEAN